MSAFSSSVRSFRIEPGASFSADMTSVRAPLGPLACNCVKITLIRDGTGVAAVPGHGPPIFVKPEHAVVTRPGVPCRVIPDGTLSLSRVMVAGPYMLNLLQVGYPQVAFDPASARMVSMDLWPEPFRLVTIPAPSVAGVVDSVEVLTRLTAAGSLRAEYLQAQQLVLGVLGVVLPLVSGGRRPLQPLLPVFDEIHWWVPGVRAAYGWIVGHYRDQWTATDLAGVAGMSVSGLSKAFTAQVGMSPMMVRDVLRLTAMAKVLIRTTTGVTDAARQVGWSPDRAVSRFQAFTGLTPSGWRERARARAVEAGEPADLLLGPADLTQFRGWAGLPTLTAG